MTESALRDATLLDIGASVIVAAGADAFGSSCCRFSACSGVGLTWTTSSSPCSSLYVSVCALVHVCMCVCVCVFICLYAYVRARVCVRVRVYICECLTVFNK